MNRRKKEAQVNRIISDIKKIKIQGARNIAIAALKAYSMLPSKKTKEKLIKARVTEPLLVNTLKNFEKLGYKKTLSHFQEAQNKINKLVLKLIKNNSVIFTHCHSTNVIQSLIYAKKKGEKFQVYNTETRPLYQGRITARELRKAGIKVTMFLDSGMDDAITEADIIFLGSDAILSKGIVNKIGSEAIAEISYLRKKPLYIIADSWKFTRHVKLEQRNFQEVWKNAPENIKIKNPAFEFVPGKYIKAVVSELGILSLDKFTKKVN